MSDSATLTITSGPDRGKVFALTEELVHVGHGPMNHVNLADAEVADHQASIVRRNGRFAIYTPLQQRVEVDGAPLPAERWVWLPNRAVIKVGEQTALQFEASTGRGPTSPPPLRRGTSSRGTDGGTATGGSRNGESDSTGTRAAASQAAASGASSKRIGKPSAPPRSKSKGRQVARFITDRAGESRVTLGEDGHLPELNLAEQADRQSPQPRSAESNPALLYTVVTASFCLSIAMLFIDMGPSGSSSEDKAVARRAVTEFYGAAGEEPELYQRYLREAQLAHSRGELEAERRAYRKVLDLLNSEDNQNRYANTDERYLGIITGTPQGDERLREHISVLLR